MKKCTLLVVTIHPPSMFDKRNSETKKILSELKQRLDLKVIWVYYGFYNYSEDETTSDYLVINATQELNAYTICKNHNPDLVLIHYVFELTNLSFVYSAKYLKIPIVTCFFDTPYFYNKKDPFYTIGMQLQIGISKTSGFNFHYGHKRFHGFFYTLKKYQFLLKTLNSTHYNFFYKFKLSLQFFWLRLLTGGIVHKLVEGDLNLCSTKDWIPLLKREKFSKIIKVVGNPITDDLFFKIKNSNKSITDTKKTKILLVTPAMFEHKLWSRKSETSLIINAIKQVLTNKNEFQIDVKIHPTSSSFDEYCEILKDFKTSVKLYQKEDLADLLQNYDLMVTYGGSSAVIYGVLLKKPTIYLLNSELSFEYTSDRTIFYESNIDDLLENIRIAKKQGIDNESVKKFIEKELFKFDGKCTERVLDAILNLTQYKNNKQ